MGDVPMIAIKLCIFLLISLNPNLSDSLPGEWVGGNGFSESPAVFGNVCVNPALADTQDCISVNFRLLSDDYTDTDGDFYSAFFVIPVRSSFCVGGNFNLLFDPNMKASAADSGVNYHNTTHFARVGGIYRFGVFLKSSLGPLSLGMDVNLLNGKINDMWWIDFEEYYDVYYTVSTYFRGYSLGLGFNFNLKNLSIGGYYCPYQDINKWEVVGEEEEFELDSPLRFGCNYSFGESGNITFSIDREESIVSLNYGFLKLGYGRMYSMGNGLEVTANRFLGGFSLVIGDVPVSIMFENRRYSGNFADSEFIGSLGIALSGKGRKNEKEKEF
jgi:hypothetical protein